MLDSIAWSATYYYVLQEQ